MEKKKKRRGLSEKERGLGWGKKKIRGFLQIFAIVAPRGMPRRFWMHAWHIWDLE